MSARPRIGGTWKGPTTLGGSQRRFRTIANPPRNRAALKLGQRVTSLQPASQGGDGLAHSSPGCYVTPRAPDSDQS